MNPPPCSSIDDVRWKAVINSDQAADDQFVYAVKTTGVFCRPSCGSRNPNRNNVSYFASSEEAIAAGFRACKRCRPNLDRREATDDALIVQACRIIDAADSPPSVKSLATAIDRSESHVHRLFVSILGITPNAYAKMKRDERMKIALRSNLTITEAIYEAGYQSSSRFYSQSKESLGMTPKAFRSGGRGEEIRFALGQCSLGRILVAATHLGICSIALGNSEDELVHELRGHFSEAKLIGDDNEFATYVATVVAFIESPDTHLNLPLDIRGTAFQRRVWDALRETMPGETLTYSELADRIGSPNATRAVASACGSNAIALAIPCHRVVRADGKSSGYRWGIERKEALLERERQS